MDHPTDVEAHLRAASDAIMLLAAQVSQLETHKRGVPADDGRFEALAHSVKVAAQNLADFAAEEEAWAQGASAARPDAATIDETPAPAGLQQLLAHWREVDRALDAAEPGSSDAERLFLEFEAARDAYMTEFRKRAGR